MAEKQANTKQHTEVELYYLKIIHILHSRYHPKIIVHVPKNKQKKKYICKNEDENEK